MADETDEITQATALVAKWSKEYRSYLKDGGGSSHAVHPAASAALIDHVAQALIKQKAAFAAHMKPARKPEPSKEDIVAAAEAEAGQAASQARSDAVDAPVEDAPKRRKKKAAAE